MIRGVIVAVALVVASKAVAADQIVLTEGTPITVTTISELSSKTAQVGYQVRMEVVDQVDVRGVRVIDAGAPVYGEVTAAQRNGHIGKPGSLTVEINYIKLADRNVRVRGRREARGAGGGGAVVATTVLLSPLGLLAHGKSASIPANTAFTAYVLADTPVAALPRVQ